MKNNSSLGFLLGVAVATTGIVMLCVFLYDRVHLVDYLLVWIIGVLFSAIELGSRYKDDPWFVVSSAPGMLYLFANGLVCCIGLFVIYTFDLLKADPTLKDLAQRTTNVLYASLGSFLVMRSSFLKLGSDNSQLDIGLNLLLKKLLEMIDRQVDRVRAERRSEDITRILKNVSYEDVSKKLKVYCVQIMQNVAIDERDKLFTELVAIEASDEDEGIKKLSAGLHIYNIVGKNVLEAAVKDLQLTAVSSQGDSSIILPQLKVNSMFLELLKKQESLKKKSGP